jgi:hypothetical protein
MTPICRKADKGQIVFDILAQWNEQGQGKLVPAIVEWPGEISQDGLSFIPPPIPQWGGESSRQRLSRG